MRMQSARMQRDAISELSKLEVAFIYYDCHYDGSMGFGEDKLRGPLWLRNLVGDDFFNHVARVNLTATEADDTTLEYLAAFPKLRSLLLDETTITDDGLKRLRGLHNLEHLSLLRTQVTDDGLKNLADMTCLRWLMLSSNFSDSGLAHLAGLTNLEGLHISSPNITDAGLKHLRGLTNLREVSLFNIPHVTDAGLQHLMRLTSLESLDLYDTQVTPEGVERLKRALPECKIDYQPPTRSGEENGDGTFRSTVQLAILILIADN